MIKKLIFLLSLNLPLYAEDLHKLNSAVESLSPSQNALYKALADDLRCPTCTGLSVLQSDTPFSVEIKTALVEQVQAGKSEKEILNFFKERFGLWILRSPPKEGFHWFAWYLPIGFIVFGALAVWGIFWRKKLQPEASGVRSTEIILQEMEEEIQRRRDER